MAASGPVIDPEHIDDVLYFVRVNEKEELDQTLQQLSQHYSRPAGEILSQCIDPSTGNTVLHYAAANGLEDLTASLLSLLSSVTFVDQRNQQGNTALHWAALNGHTAVVKKLVESGADMWLKNAAGHLALFEAERAEKNDVVQYLLQAGGKEVERTGIEAEEEGDAVGATSSAQADAV